MSDKEKITMLIGFLKGTIGSNSYICCLDIEATKELIRKIENNA